MSLIQTMHFLQYVFHITAIALVSIMNHYHINGLHQFWDIIYSPKDKVYTPYSSSCELNSTTMVLLQK